MEKLFKELLKAGFSISTSKNKLQMDIIHGFLAYSYWADGLPIEIVKKAVRNSFAFGVYFNKNQRVGFARVISDYTLFAHLADVFILKAYRGKGLAKWLIYEIMNHPRLQKKWMLATEDAHGLYSKIAFTKMQKTEINMEKIIHPNYIGR